MFNEGCQLQLCPRKQALFIKCCPLPSVFNISHESIINGIVTHRKKVLGKHYFKDNAKEINGGLIFKGKDDSKKSHLFNDKECRFSSLLPAKKFHIQW